MYPHPEFVPGEPYRLLPQVANIMTIAPQEMHRVARYGKRPRRRADEVQRYYRCNYPDCDKAYGALNHLNTHVRNANHGPKREPKEFQRLRLALKLRKKQERASENSPSTNDDVYQSGPQLSVPGEPYEYTRLEAPTHHAQQRASEHSKSGVYHSGLQISVPGEPYEHSRLETPTYDTRQTASEYPSLRSNVHQSGAQLSVPAPPYEHSPLEGPTYHTATLHAPCTQSAGYFPFQSQVASARTLYPPSEERYQEDRRTPPPSDPIHSGPSSPDNYHNLTTRHPTFAGNLHTRHIDTSSSREAESGSVSRSYSQYPRHYVHRPNGPVHPQDPYRSYVRKEFDYQLNGCVSVTDINGR